MKLETRGRFSYFAAVAVFQQKAASSRYVILDVAV